MIAAERRERRAMTGADHTGLGGPAALTGLVVMGAMWGLQFAMLKLAAQGGHSDLSILMTALIALSAAFLAVCKLRGERLVMTRRIAVFVTVACVLGYIVPLLATLAASEALGAGLLTLFGCLSPVVAVAVAVAFRTERVSPSRALGLVLGLAAVGLILVPELRLPNLGAAPYMLIALAVPVAYGVESVYVAHTWPQELSPLVAVTLETLAAAVLTAPAFLIWGVGFPDVTAWGEAETAIAVFVAAGVVESVLYFYLIRHSGGVFVNFGTFVALFAGLAWGMVLFGETHGGVVWLAVALLAASLYLSFRDPA
jgi:drug/metabolite transporter (DMT)-like permease